MKSERYPAALRILHWLMAVLIPAQFGMGWAAEHLARDEFKKDLMVAHFQLGITVLGLLVVRLSWRLASRIAPPQNEPLWRTRAAFAVHASIHALIFAISVSGYIIWVWMQAPMAYLGIFDIPRLFMPPDEERVRALSSYAHVWGGWVLCALVALHIGAALWHQLVRKDDLVRQRMFSGPRELLKGPSQVSAP